MFLITSYYIQDEVDRQNEINTALQLNIDNSNIDHIYLLNDKIYNLDFLTNYKHKVSQVKINLNKLDFCLLVTKIKYVMIVLKIATLILFLYLT